MVEGLSVEEAVRGMLLLLPKVVGRVKRLPAPEALRGMDLAPRHLSLLAYLQYEGSLTVGELADRLEIAPTTVSLMVGNLSRRGVLARREDERDRRRRIVTIEPAYAAAIDAWLSASARAWTAALADLPPAHRRIVVDTFRAYEAALAPGAD
jgi:DNA-binding MarR family transcriptional regulator